jgi:thiol-disulfide isomerase/thioredoxin
MATATFVLEIAARAPEFSGLLGVDGKRYSLSSFDNSRFLIVVFTSNGCPTVRAFEGRLGEIEADHGREGVRVVAINANNPHLSPGDSYEEMVRRAGEKGFPFSYLKDEDGSVARAYGAISTPHAFLFDQDRRLRYQGRIADSRIPEKVTTPDLENALQDLLAGRPPRVSVTVPFGCSIVW